MFLRFTTNAAHKHTLTYTHTHTHTSSCTYTENRQVHTPVNKNKDTHTAVRVHAHTPTQTHTFIRTHSCIHKNAHTRTYTHTHAHTFIHTHTACTHMNTRIRVHTRLTHACTNLEICKCKYKRTCACTLISPGMHTRTLTCTQVHTILEFWEIQRNVIDNSYDVWYLMWIALMWFVGTVTINEKKKIIGFSHYFTTILSPAKYCNQQNTAISKILLSAK